jgi:hypothetical protein
LSRVSLRGLVVRATGAAGAALGVLVSFSADMAEDTNSEEGEGCQMV